MLHRHRFFEFYYSEFPVLLLLCVAVGDEKEEKDCRRDGESNGGLSIKWSNVADDGGGWG